jgi:hypothetical protein
MSELTQVFGALEHQFAVEEPLTREDLAELETWLRVRLPEEYREFLLTVGAGGAGPAYGVFPVRQTDRGFWHWIGHGGDLTVRELMGRPFPDQLAPEVAAQLEAAAPDEDAFEDYDDYEAAYEAWENRVSELLRTPERTTGAICLCHRGCNSRVWLVVTGPERGRMYDDQRCDDVDLAALMTADGEPVTFDRWYLDWLRDAEAACGLTPVAEGR